MKKFILTGLLLSIPWTAGAIIVDGCNEEFIYEQRSIGAPTAGFGDYYDHRVSIDFNFPLAREIRVETNDPYEIVKVELDVDDDGHSGYFDYTDEFPGTFNPSPGSQIEKTKVTVKKVCPPEPTPEPEPEPEPTPEPDPTPEPEPEPTPIPAPAPQTTPSPSSGGRHPVWIQTEAEGYWYCPQPLRQENDPMGYCAGKYVNTSPVGVPAEGQIIILQKLVEALSQLVSVLNWL